MTEGGKSGGYVECVAIKAQTLVYSSSLLPLQKTPLSDDGSGGWFILLGFGFVFFAAFVFDIEVSKDSDRGGEDGGCEEGDANPT